jgi:Ferritin-like domain
MGQRAKEQSTMSSLFKEKEKATSTLLASYAARRSRGTFLKGAVAAGLAVVGADLLPALPAAADEEIDAPQTIFNIGATAKALAVTFYSYGVREADDLRLTGINLDNITAALIEEQLHYDFFVAHGGTPRTTTFSFPHGEDTFDHLDLFLATQQQLEGTFASAFIAAVYELAAQRQPDLARIACQIAMIESEHRALGRQIGAEQISQASFDPAANWVFAPQLMDDMNDAPKVLAAAGYLSPKSDNRFTYHHVDFSSASLAPIYHNIMFKASFVAPEE